jgi:hypothetical protein
VCYIHLNPLRAKIVAELKDLAKYPYGGHSVLMGKQKRDFQDVDYVLQLFGDKVAEARRNYREYFRKRIDLARQPELVGGGLLRSTGGWAVLKAMSKIDSGYEFKLNKMRNAFFHVRPYYLPIYPPIN